jgi:hypothetical protein
VDLVQVDVVHAERAQAVVHSLAQPGRARVAHELSVGHPQTVLGRDHEVVAPLRELVAQGAAEQALGGSETVGLRRVEDVDSQLAGATDRLDCLASSNAPQSPPSCQAPNAIGVTSSPVLPRITVRM